ncbi:MAG: hypothetical protein E7536_04665 [Ruminococcaceae bacterium]|nr:hypothetical protein [Oscillospiraceae bacterium]
MKNILDVDKNFRINPTIRKDDIEFFDIRNSPFKIYGVFHENGKFRRLPEKVATETSADVEFLHKHTAGGRVRFATDSDYVAIYAVMSEVGKMSHFALTGSAGFDLYIRENGKERYFKTFMPPFDIEDGYESVVDFGNSNMKEITINFPLYSNVVNLFVGIRKNACLKEHSLYKTEKPVVFYGSSITQGGCASRPGLSYESILSRKLDVNHINLGFSGCARGEDRIAEYISGLDMSAFVYDYDHNAPTAEHLRNTHEKMFAKIREKNPDLPVIMMSRPKFILTEEEKERLEIVKSTYLSAKEKGDKNVYFIDGPALMSEVENEGTVDDCHPNDSGFMSMAKAIEKVLEKLL